MRVTDMTDFSLLVLAFKRKKKHILPSGTSPSVILIISTISKKASSPRSSFSISSWKLILVAKLVANLQISCHLGSHKSHWQEESQAGLLCFKKHEAWATDTPDDSAPQHCSAIWDPGDWQLLLHGDGALPRWGPPGQNLWQKETGGTGSKEIHQANSVCSRAPALPGDCSQVRCFYSFKQ